MDRGNCSIACCFYSPPARKPRKFRCFRNNSSREFWVYRNYKVRKAYFILAYVLFIMELLVVSQQLVIRHLIQVLCLCFPSERSLIRFKFNRLYKRTRYVLWNVSIFVEVHCTIIKYSNVHAKAFAALVCKKLFQF